MRTEARFLLAVGLMLVVLVGTNVLFPPIPPEVPPGASPDSAQVESEGPGGEPSADTGGRPSADPSAMVPDVPSGVPAVDSAQPSPEPAEPATPVVEESRIPVSTPLFDLEFSNLGARLVSAELGGFRSLRRDGPVDLVREDSDGALGQRLLVQGDTVDLSRLPFQVEPAGGLDISDETGPQELTFRYRDAGSGFEVELTYTFVPDRYVFDARASVAGVGRALALTGLGAGLPSTEADSAAEAGMMAWVGNHRVDGVRSHPLGKLEERVVQDGPFLWAAYKSKFFVFAVLPGSGMGEDDLLGGIIAEPDDGLPRVTVAQNLGADGSYDYRVFAGPQDYARLQALGDDFEEVNPYGWRWLRPLLRPIVGAIIWVLTFLHNTLSIGYGWVLILFGLIMRVVLWPLNQKAMRAQMRNMAVQPLLKEIQTKYKDNPEKLQKEMMKLYKEHGFNPLAGCLPMLLPWPVLIALFFVFQNTIEFRAVEFLWLPDLSAPDPYYLLPVFLAASMFAVQYISYKSMDQANPQMKMMMWFMPLFLGFIFMQFASGLNLYYATSNLAMIPQQYLIAKERKAARQEMQLKRTDD